MPSLETMRIEELFKRSEEEYCQRTPTSRQIHSLSKKFLPGGDTRSITYFKPYPFFTERAEGYRIFDVDGNSYVDFVNNYASLVHGHAHPKIIGALKAQLEKGWTYATGMKCQLELAEIICKRFPSIKKIRFCNSGTEGTMGAIRAARAYTGKDKILKMEGGYHGTHPTAEISTHPDIEKAGPADKPLSVPNGPGIPESVARKVLVVPFNNNEVAERIIRENKKDLAAVIVEPMMGAAGQIPPKDGYLKSLREATAAHDVLLIFDEVMTARLAVGGGQEFFDVTPDLTTLGKIIGGDLPVGAFGGRDDIMELFSPEGNGGIHHSGTFNGNALTMVAGMVTLKMLTSSAIDRINLLGNLLKNNIEKAFEEAEIAVQVTGAGSLHNIHFTSEDVIDYRTASTSNKEAVKLLFFSLLSEGVFISPGGAVLHLYADEQKNDRNIYRVPNEKYEDTKTSCWSLVGPEYLMP